MSGTLTHTSRNASFTALFNFMKQAPTPTGGLWKYFSQRLQQWDAVPPANQPAMFLHRGPQMFEQKHAFGVTKQVWRCTIWIYFRIEGLLTDSTYPDQLVDDYLDKLEVLFQTDPLVGRQTLNGLVYHVWIDGSVVWDTVTDDQGILVLPISILPDLGS